jgi:transcriptional regulator GlxA family with amidase domain
MTGAERRADMDRALQEIRARTARGERFTIEDLAWDVARMSADGFLDAFRKAHGKTPRQARREFGGKRPVRARRVICSHESREARP